MRRRKLDFPKTSIAPGLVLGNGVTALSEPEAKKKHFAAPTVSIGNIQGSNISCHDTHFTPTEDIWLKSASKVERGILLRSGRKS